MISPPRCKEEYAHCVKAIAPSSKVLPSRDREFIAMPANEFHGKTAIRLDIGASCHIIVFTYIGLPDPRSVHACRSRQARQASGPAAARYAQPSPGRRHTRAVREQRVLRCRRRAAGQVREAATGQRRQAPDQRGGQGLWLLASVVLPGPG